MLGLSLWRGWLARYVRQVTVDGRKGCVLTIVMQAQPYRGLQMGNLSFTVPGLEGKADVKGNWMTVSHSREGGDDEVARNFRKFHDKLQRENEKKDMQKEPADMVEVIMQGL